MAFTPYTSLNLTQNELQNARIHYLASDPATPVIGQLYFNSSTNKLRTWNGSTWDEYGTSTASGTVTGVSIVSANGFAGTVANSSTTPAITLTTTITGLLKGNGTAISAATDADVTGKLLTGYVSGAGTVSATDSILQSIQKLNGNLVAYAGSSSITTVGTITSGTWNGTVIGSQYGGTGQNFSASSGILKYISGTASLVTAPSGALVGTTDTQTLTNKTIDASSNTISNLTTSMFATNVIDTDGSLTANSDTRIPSQKAVKTAIAAAISGVAKPMGGIDCSTNPNYPAANAGEFYRVTVAGLIGGGSGIAVTVGDEIHCFTTSAAGNQATVGANWTIVQSNVDQATTSVLGLVALADATTAEAKSNTTKALTAASVVNFPVKKTFTSAASSSGLSTTTCTHNYGTRDVVCRVYRTASPYDEVLGDVEHTTTNTLTVKLYGTFSSGDFTIVTLG